MISAYGAGPASILALVVGHEAVACVRATAGERTPVVWCRSTEELATAGAYHANAIAAIIELQDIAGRSTLPAVVRLREHAPWMPILVYCSSLTPKVASDLLVAGRVGVDDIVIWEDAHGRDGAHNAINALIDRRLAAIVLPDIAPLLPPELRPFFVWCLEHAAESLTVSHVAKHFGRDRKTLLNRLNRASLPKPSTILHWCRLIAAARLLDETERSVEQVAFGLGFESGPALTHFVKRYTGLTPSALRHGGALRTVIRAFVSVLSAASIPPDSRP